MRCLISTLALIMIGVASARAAEINTRMSIVEAIDALRAEGYQIAYSTLLVKDWMRVRENPAGADPIAGLRQVLSAYDLALEEQIAKRWLVVKADPALREAKADPAPVAPIAAPKSPAPVPIDEITIVGSRHSMFSTNATDQFLTGSQIRQLPHVADDAFRAFHRLPGVAASDFQAPFNVRGGATDEVLVELNGVEIFEPFHMRTLFQPLSIIDPGIIGEAGVLSGGFTARHGNYMSGVIDITTERSSAPAQHELGVSFFNAFARSKGAMLGGRGSYLLSARRGYLDLVADQVTDDGEKLSPRFADLYANLSYDVSDNVEVSLQALLSDDDVRFVDPDDGENFGEESSLRYLWLTASADISPRVRASSSLLSGRVDSTESGSQLNFPSEDLRRFFDRQVDVTAVQTDWSFLLADSHFVEAGVRYRDLSATFDYRLNATRSTSFVDNGVPFSVTRDLQQAAAGSDLGVYGSYRRRIGQRLTFEAGLRWDSWDYAGSGRDDEMSPRFNAVFDVGERAEIRAAWGRYAQPQSIGDLDVPDAELEYHSVERAEHRVLGLRYRFKTGLALQADMYEKRYLDLARRYENVLDLYEFTPESNFDRIRIDPESGRVRGIELTLNHQLGDALDWWFNYTWSEAEDRVDGVDVRRNWDQRDAVTANLTWRPGDWTISIIARYRSGWPRTPLLVSPVTDSSGSVVGVTADLSRRNTEEFEDYSRVDIRASRTRQFKRSSFEYYFEVFNVFNQENQCCTSSHTLSISPGVTVAPQFDDFLPFFPSFGFVWRFGPGALTSD